jgi:hypothetical protein
VGKEQLMEKCYEICLKEQEKPSFLAQKKKNIEEQVNKEKESA